MLWNDLGRAAEAEKFGGSTKRTHDETTDWLYVNDLSLDAGTTQALLTIV
jgi:hypothetical protein